MGCRHSKPSQAPAGRRAFPAPLPPPMQDNMNELLNRWRHGEVNLLQRRFRLARAQPVKHHTIGAKIRGTLTSAPSSNSGTATSAATTINSSANRDASSAEDGSSSPMSRDEGVEGDSTSKQGEGPVPPPVRVGGGSGDIEEAVSIGDVGGARAGMDKEAFLRVFPDVKGLPVDVQRSAFRLFDCVGRGSLDFRNFCRALALCCRGSREERLRFLFDLFSGISQPKHYGTGADGGARDALASACLSEADLTALKKQVRLPAGADHAQFQQASGADGMSAPAVDGGGLLLVDYFRWAELNVSDEALDRALRPFYLLPSPQQEKDKVLALLVEHTIREGQWMCLVASPWWLYWCNYTVVTKEDLERVPERMALGLGLNHGMEQAREDGPAGAPPHADIGSTSLDAAGERRGQKSADNTSSASDRGENGGVYAYVSGSVQDKDVGGASKERPVPTTLARRPHEMDNSSLQGEAEWEVSPNLELGVDYVLLPKSLWDVMSDWYGGGPVFSRQVVKMSAPSLQLPLSLQAGRGKGDASVPTATATPADSLLMVDLYPLALHVVFCDSSGRPSGRERLELTSLHAHVKDLLAELGDRSRLQGFRRGLTVTVPPSDDQDALLANGNVNKASHNDGSNERDAVQADAGDEQTSVRLWLFEISRSGLTDTPRAQMAAGVSSVCRPRFSFVGGGVLRGCDPQSGVSRWKLVKAEEEVMSLSALGLMGGEKVMVETKLPDGTWPRRRYIEEPDFRQFREGDRVDAMDYQGRWFRGQIVEVGHRSAYKIVDSEGPVGKKKSSRRPRPQTPAEEGSRVGSGQDLQDRDQSEGSGGRLSTGSSGSKSGTGKTGSGQRRGSGGDASGGGREGSATRRRMRVRVHFDKFAPQWDEWYDSKSLKLAPELTHTAPPVPSQPTLKPTEEGTADGEAEEEGSPNAPRRKNGTTSTTSNGAYPPKSGGSAYPSTVDRFSGDAASGNGWNPRNSGYAPSRSNGAGPSGTSAGITNHGGGTLNLNRRSNTPGKPPLAGACGLVNVGNTCYLNSAVQCLSHTPLLRAYLLSDMWAAEVNKYNPLGTQGKLVEDFASLLKSLWSQEYLCIFPSKFRRGLIKYKPQFAGNEQQDSQEFLAEMLDALHEDVNRVIDKPYVPAPDGDEADSGRSDQDLADEAWDRHVQRNRSVIVDLFQGQLKMECKCTICNKKSVTFDPFMYLSVPIPIRNEKMVAVVLLPTIRTRDIAGSGGKGGGSEAAAADGLSNGAAVEFSNPRRLVPVQYGMMLPRLGELSDLKRALSDLCRLPASSLVVSVLLQYRVRVFADKDPLTNIREDDIILAFAMGNGVPNKQAPAVSPVPTPVESVAASATANGPGLPMVVENDQTDKSSEAGLQGLKDTMPRKVANGSKAGGDIGAAAVANGVTGAEQIGVAAAEDGGGDGEQGQGRAVTEALPGGTEDATATATAVSPRGAAAEGVWCASDGEEETDLDDDRPPKPNADRRSPDERCMESFPSKFEDLEVGWRLDALDGQGHWYPATVVEVDPQAKRLRRDGDKPLKSSPGSKGDDQRRKTERVVKIHFDGFTSKWDERYGEQDWNETKLIPLYSKSRAQEHILDISVVHRKTIKVPAPGSHSHSGSFPGGGKGDGLSTRDAAHEGDGRNSKESPGGIVTAKNLFGLPFLVRCPPKRSARYLWRLVVQQASRFVAGSSGSRGFKAGGRDRMAKAAAGASKRPHVTAAWVARAAVGLESDITDEKLAELLPFTIKFVLKQNPLVDVGSVELLPDRWRAASSLICPKLILALEWKDASRDYLDVLNTTFDHPSYSELENNAQSAHSGLTLQQCLDAYTREETLEEEDSWYCSNCRAHRRGIMKIDLWKMPDVLVMHMKRFHCSARWREKIRTLVLFPQSGLDMSGFVSANSAHRNQAGGGQASMVYDLFGVVNHMGGMTGGHYTANCRSSPCTKDGVEEVTGWGLEHPWLNFDDEIVEEMAPDKIVSEAAYVLFYRRRRLTPSNVINMTI